MQDVLENYSERPEEAGLKEKLARLERQVNQLQAEKAALQRQVKEAASSRLTARLEEAEAFYAGLFEGVPDAILVADAQGRYINANGAASIMLGYSHSELFQMGVANVMNLSAAETEAMFAEFIRAGSWRGEIELRHKDGRLIPAESNAIVVNLASGPIYVAIIRDISGPIMARRQLQTSEARLAQILETIGEGIGIIDLNGRISFANLEAEKILRLQRSVITTRTYDDPRWQSLTVEGKPLPPGEHPLAKMLQTGQPIFNEEIALDIPDRKRIYLSINAAPLRDGEGHLIGGIGSFRDITERKELEKQKDEFLTIISHDLRSPLTIIKGHAELLRGKLEQQLEREEESGYSPQANLIEGWLRSTRPILHQSQRLDELIHRLLEFSRIQGGHLALRYNPRANLVDLVKEAVEQHAITTSDHLIILQAPEKAIWLAYDEARLEQVVDNLITNAIKYSPPETSVKVGIKAGPETAEVVVWVQDEGFGIGQEDQKRLFERFYRVSTEQTSPISGLGLGLYISRGIIEQHGGRVWVESQPGKGSTFYFSLPLEA